MPTNAPPTEPAVERAGHQTGAWATLREALRGSQQDFTQVPIGRATVLLAVPMVMEMAMESLFAVVDIFWVSKLGADAIATVGLTESLLAMIYAVALGLSTAGTAMVARRIGEKDPDAAGVAAVHIIGVSILVAVVIGIGGALSGSFLLTAMGASRSVVEIGSGYAALMLGGNITIMLLFGRHGRLLCEDDRRDCPLSTWSMEEGTRLIVSNEVERTLPYSLLRAAHQ